MIIQDILYAPERISFLYDETKSKPLRFLCFSIICALWSPVFALLVIPAILIEVYDSF